MNLLNVGRMKTIFVDTSAWIEYFLENERYSQPVLAYFQNEIKKGSRFVTSDYVLDETLTRLLTNQSVRSANGFYNYIREAEKQKNLLVIWINEGIFQRSWNHFIKFSEHKLSFTDATIATFVKDLRIDEILTLDQGFTKVGFTVRPKLR